MLTVPWLFLVAGTYAWDQTIKRWRTGGDSAPFAWWGFEDIRSVALFPLDEFLIMIWIGVAAVFIAQSLRRRARVPALVPIGIFLPLVAFAAGHISSREYARLFVSTIGPGAAGGTLLADAAARGDTVAINSLLAKGIDVEAADHAFFGTRSDDGETALMTAATRGQLGSVALLLRRGANPNHANSYGETPLMRGVGSNDVDIVRLLLAHGADPRALTHYRAAVRQGSALGVAEQRRNPVILDLIRTAADSAMRADKRPPPD